MAIRNSKGQFVKGHLPVGNVGGPKGIHNSPSTEFKKGFTPWNKGTKGVVKSWNKGKKTGISWNRGKGKPLSNCMDCGKFTSTYRTIRCINCRIQYIKLNPPKKGKEGLRREKNPNWKGGTGTERHRLMGQAEYKLWRIAVFLRDDYTCQKCNTRGGELNADHIKPWALYPDLRYAIDNGRTLCVSCHRNTETWGYRVYGRKVLG